MKLYNARSQYDHFVLKNVKWKEFPLASLSFISSVLSVDVDCSSKPTF